MNLIRRRGCLPHPVFVIDVHINSTAAVTEFIKLVTDLPDNVAFQYHPRIIPLFLACETDVWVGAGPVNPP